MKKAFLLVILTISVSSLFAQSFNIGIRGGLNESSLDYTQVPNNTPSRLAGFNAGLFVDYGLGDFTIEPGLFYTTKGQKNSFSSSGTANGETSTTSGTGKVTYNYIELPLNILYNIRIPIGKIFLGGGPYTAIGLSGTSKITTTTNTNGVITYGNYYSNNKLTFGNTVNDIKRQDYGLGAIGGLRLKNGLMVSAGYEHGLSNIANAGTEVKHDVINFSIGYAFL